MAPSKVVEKSNGNEKFWTDLSPEIQRKIRESVATFDQSNMTRLETQKQQRSLDIFVSIDQNQLAAGGRRAELYLAGLVYQSQRIRQVFALLDKDGKGCVVANDILRASANLAIGNEQTITEEEANEMVEEFVGEDCVMSLQDLAAIAERVNL